MTHWRRAAVRSFCPLRPTLILTCTVVLLCPDVWLFSGTLRVHAESEHSLSLAEIQNDASYSN